MSRPLQLTSWNHELEVRFGNFPTPVVAVLAIYSFGMTLARVSGLTSVALYLAEHLGLAYDPLRKRLREFYLDADDKSGVKNGVKRRDFDVTGAFDPLLRWILSLWAGKYLPLAIDVTNLGDRFHVLCVSVVVRGTALPVAWKVFRGGHKQAWNPAWVALLEGLKAAVPGDWTVVVLSDRGLESPDLFKAITGLNWHPLMRVKKDAKFRPAGQRRFVDLLSLTPEKGRSLNLAGLAYKGRKMPATLLLRWDEGYDEPWLVLTDLPPESADAVWYGLRTWIEQGFKMIKGGGWQWDKTRMEDPERVERLWLVMAVASLWVVAVGVGAEVEEERRREGEEMQRRLRETAEQEAARQAAGEKRRAAALEAIKRRQAERAGRRKQRSKKSDRQAAGRHPDSGATARRRQQRLSKRGIMVLSVAREQGQVCLPQCLHPEPWPTSLEHAAPNNDLQLSPDKT